MPPPPSRFDDLADKWGGRYPAAIRLWDNAWPEFMPLLDYVSRSTRDLLRKRDRVFERPYRRAVRARGHFPGEQVTLKRLYVVPQSRNRSGSAGPDGRCAANPALSAPVITFRDPFPVAETS